MATFTWFGGSGNGGVAKNWTPSGGPPRPGDTAIVNAGIVQITDSQFNSNTLLLNVGTFQLFNTLETVASSSFDFDTTLIAGTSGAAALDIFGGFLNDGTIEAVANTLTLAIGADVHAGATIAGTLVNDGLIEVLSAATLDVTGGYGNTFQGGSVDLKGATALITATDSASNYTLGNGSTLALDSASSGDTVTFAGTGDLLRLYAPALLSTISIDGFASGDTLDIGAQAIGTLTYQSPQAGGPGSSGTPVLTILNTTGGTILSDPFTSTEAGLVGNKSGTAAVSTLPGGGVAAGPFEIVTVGNGDTLLELLPPSTWLWTGADPTNLNDPNNFLLVGGPGNQSDTIVSGGTHGQPAPGDTIFANNATFAFPSNNTINGNTIYMTGTGEMSFIGTQAVTGGAGNAGISYQNPTVDQTSVITNRALVPAATTLNFAGYNVNEGTLIGSSSPGSDLTINVTQNGTAPGTFINYGEIEAAPHGGVIINVTGTSELFNANLIYANGGTVAINASPAGIAGGYAPMLGGVALIGDGGTLVLNTGYPSGTEGSSPVFAFYDGDSGETLRLQQVGQFGGRILGFQQGDTIDLGQALNVGTIAVTADGRVMLENPGGTVLASLVLSSGAYSSGTYAVTSVAAGTLAADGLTLTTGWNGDTFLNTNVVNSVWNDASGTWQTAADWSTGVVPGAASTVLIGEDATASADIAISPFDITTGAAPVTADSLSEVNSSATLQVTSATTVGTSANHYGITQIAGEIEVTGGNTLTATFLKQSSPAASLQVDPGAVLSLTGHGNLGFANSGTLSEFTVVNGTTFANGNSMGLFVTGTATVDGGTIDAGPASSGTNVASSGGFIAIGADGGGTPSSMTVGNGGTVTDTYADLSSDPSSFGLLTLTGGGTTWDDAGDPTDRYNTRGDMLVGNNNQSGNQPSPSPAGTAQLLVENGATLNEANGAYIGQSADSAGSATIAPGGIWNIGTSGAGGGTGGFLNVGNAGSGTLDIDGGSVNVLAGSGTLTANGTTVTGAAGMGIAHQAGSDGTVAVWGGGALNITISPTIANAGLGVGQAGHGELDIYDGGTVTVTDGGTSAGSSQTGTGTITVGGSSGAEGSGGGSALLIVAGDTISGGMSIGKSGAGTLFVNTGGTVQVSGGAIDVGKSAAASGFAEIAGGLVNDTTNGLDVGDAGTGTLELLNAGTISLTGGGINIGESAGAQGLLEIASGGMLTSATNGMDVGLNAGSAGTLEVLAGGIYNIGTHGISAGVCAGAAGTILVSGAGALINIGTETGGYGVSIGQAGAGFLAVQANGTVSDAGASITVGQDSGSAGTVAVASGGLVTTSGTTGITVGGQGRGVLTIGSGGTVAAGNFFSIAQGGTAGTGSVAVNGGTLGDAGIFNVGGAGSGTLVVAGGGVVDQTGILFNIGGGAGGQGIVAVNGGTLVAGDGMLLGGPGAGTLDVGAAGTVALASGGLTVGLSQPGSAMSPGILAIAAGGTVETGSLTEGNGGAVTVGGSLAVAAVGILIDQPGSGEPTVMTVGGSLSDAGALTVGASGAGALVVQGGHAALTGGGPFVAGLDSGGSGAVTVDGGTLDAGASAVTLGNASGSSGAVTVESGGTFAAGAIAVGGGNAGGNASGAVTVSGAGSRLTARGQIEVGQGGTGNLLIENQATATASGLDIGQLATGSGQVTVAGTRSALSNADRFVVGDAGLGSLSIEGGGTVATAPGIVAGLAGAVIAGAAGSDGSSVTVTGRGSDWRVGGPLQVGYAATGELDLSNGASVTASALDAGGQSGGAGIISVSGAGTDLATAGTFSVGDAGAGELSVLGAGSLTIGTDLDIGTAAGGTGNVDIENTAGTVFIGGNLNVGTGGYGELVIGPGVNVYLDNGIENFGPNASVVQFSLIDPPPALRNQSPDDQLKVSGADAFSAYVDNTGGIEITSGHSVAFDTPIVYGAGGAFTIDGNAELVLNADTVTGQTINFGPGSTLVIGQDVLSTIDTPPSGTTFTPGPNPNKGAALIEGGFQDDVLNNFSAGDTIVVTTGEPATFDHAPGGTVVSVVENGATVGALTFFSAAAADTAFTTGGALTDTMLCFLPGTLIRTPSGQAAVEHLNAGDLVLTAAGRARPVAWAGVGRVLATRGRRNAATPVIVRKGALAPNVPHEDLRVTKGHSFLLDGVLVPVEFLVNHRSILWDDRAQEVSVHHVELETHDVLLANGAPAESYRDDGNRWLFRNANTGWDQPPKPPCAPVLTGGPIVDGVWRRLLDRCGPRPGVPLTGDPDLHLLVDGARVDAANPADGVHVFDLPHAPASIRIASRSVVPQELGIARDPRCLGVAVKRIAARQGARFRVALAGDKRLTDGFHDYEADRSLRWTDGGATIPPALFAGFTGRWELVVHVAATSRYADMGTRAAAA